MQMISGGGMDVVKGPSTEEKQQKKVLKIPRGVDVGRVVGSDGKMMYWINEEHLKSRLDAAGIEWEFEK